MSVHHVNKECLLTSRRERRITHTHTYTHICIYMYAYAHRCTHACIRTHTCIRIYRHKRTHTPHNITPTGACVYPVEWSILSCFRVCLLHICWFQVYSLLSVSSAIAGPQRLPVCEVSNTSSMKKPFIQLVIYSAWSLNWVFTKNIK